MRRERPSLLGLAAAALSGAVALFYLVLIAQGAVGFAGAEVYVGIVVLVLFGQSGLAAAGALRRSVPLLAGAAIALLLTGVLALFSIGWPLIVAALLAAMAAVWTRVRQAQTR